MDAQQKEGERACTCLQYYCPSASTGCVDWKRTDLHEQEVGSCACGTMGARTTERSVHCETRYFDWRCAKSALNLQPHAHVDFFHLLMHVLRHAYRHCQVPSSIHCSLLHTDVLCTLPASFDVAGTTLSARPKHGLMISGSCSTAFSLSCAFATGSHCFISPLSRVTKKHDSMVVQYYCHSACLKMPVFANCRSCNQPPL